jgi:hypothetical protein
MAQMAQMAQIGQISQLTNSANSASSIDEIRLEPLQAIYRLQYRFHIGSIRLPILLDPKT